jgi:hypothetical protein
MLLKITIPSNENSISQEIVAEIATYSKTGLHKQSWYLKEPYGLYHSLLLAAVPVTYYCFLLTS